MSSGGCALPLVDRVRFGALTNPKAAHGNRAPFQYTACSRHASHQGRDGEAEGSSMVDGLGAARPPLETSPRSRRLGPASLAVAALTAGLRGDNPQKCCIQDVIKEARPQ